MYLAVVLYWSVEQLYCIHFIIEDSERACYKV